MKGSVMNLNTGIIYPSAQEACRQCCITIDAMSQVLSGKRRKTKEQFFCYVPDFVDEGFPPELASFRRDKLAELVHVQGLSRTGLDVFRWTPEGLVVLCEGGAEE